MEERRQSIVEYQRLGVQKMTSEEISGPICRPIYNRGGGIHQCSQIATANLNENLSGCKYQSDSTIQETSRGIEAKRG